jgi:hypothetical protein
MVTESSPTEASAIEASTSDDGGENKLRGAALDGSEQDAAADHSEYEAGRNPDTELHLDGETDTLYSDGIDLEGDSDTPAGTDGSSATIT